MLVRDCMTRSVVTVSPRTSVLNARRLLALHEIRHLPVVVGDDVVGMVSGLRRARRPPPTSSR